MNILSFDHINYICYDINLLGGFMSRIILPLDIDKRNLIYNDDTLKPIMEELEYYISDMKYINTLKFSKDVLFSHELQANNSVEGYNDDVETILEVINNVSNIKDPKKKQRIINLYKGYCYIMQGEEINQDNLRKLYSILSKELLSKTDLFNMGEYYRKNPVYIYWSSRADKEPDQGISSDLLYECMQQLIDYINTNNNLSKTELFIKSQIIHFYFVYIHPYYDINGRTSRTMSLWYLLNHKNYPFIIFNRAITLYKNEYYKVIRQSKTYKNITFFLKYMLDNTQIELEKDYVMNMIKESSSYHLTSTDYQTLHYILSMKGQLTYLDFMRFYTLQNEHKKPLEIYNDMLRPLLNNGILLEGRPTKKRISGLGYNRTISLKPPYYDQDPNKIKHLIK